MKINVKNFEDLIKKATLNFSIGSVQLKFSDKKIVSKMKTDSCDSIILLNIDNNVILNPTPNDEFTFNFSEPNQQLIPFLKLIDDDECNMDIKEEKIIIKNGKQRSNIHFCYEEIVNVFSSDSIKNDIEYFVEINIDDEFIDIFNKIKKIGSRYGNIYINVENKVLSIETSDKTNRFSNGLKFDLIKIDNEINDLSICFDFKNFSNLMSIIDSDYFKLKITYVEEQNMGMIIVENDGSEKYCLMSKE